MGYVATGPKPGEERDYVPDVIIGDWSNKADPEPVTVRLRVITEGAKRSAFAETRGDVESKAWHDAALKAAIVSVSGYTAEVGPVTTGDEFVKHAHSLVYYDVLREVLMGFGLSDAQKKT